MKKGELRKKFNIWLGDGFDKHLKESKTMTRRWLFCWDGSEAPESCFDCACCLSDEEDRRCGCLCHVRIAQIVDFFWKELKKK